MELMTSEPNAYQELLALLEQKEGEERNAVIFAALAGTLHAFVGNQLKKDMPEEYSKDAEIELDDVTRRSESLQVLLKFTDPGIQHRFQELFDMPNADPGYRIIYNGLASLFNNDFRLYIRSLELSEHYSQEQVLAYILQNLFSQTDVSLLTGVLESFQADEVETPTALFDKAKLIIEEIRHGKLGQRLRRQARDTLDSSKMHSHMAISDSVHSHTFHLSAHNFSEFVLHRIMHVALLPAIILHFTGAHKHGANLIIRTTRNIIPHPDDLSEQYFPEEPKVLTPIELHLWNAAWNIYKLRMKGDIVKAYSLGKAIGNWR